MSDQLGPGGRLPNERDLSRMLNVSRSSVREALRVLESAGIVEIRPTKGSFVVRRDQYDASSFMNWFERYKPDIFHLIETRIAIEPAAAYWAAERITQEQILRMERCHDEFVNAIMRNDVVKVALGDETFHNLIFEAAQNPILFNIYKVIQPLLIDYRKRVFSIPKEAMKAVSQHDDILRYIRERDSERAREHMLQHLLISKRGLLEAVEKEYQGSSTAREKRGG